MSAAGGWWCPRCHGWVTGDEHVVDSAVPWHGYGPLPDLIYCTSQGEEVRPLLAPGERIERWQVRSLDGARHFTIEVRRRAAS